MFRPPTLAPLHLSDYPLFRVWRCFIFLTRILDLVCHVLVTFIDSNIIPLHLRDYSVKEV
jgi:hypothetical protein